MATEALEPVDAEEALSSDLSIEACPVCPPPVPETLGDRLPWALVERDGGVRENPWVDSHNVTVSVWAGTWAEAMREADRLAGAIARLPATGGTSVQWRRADVTGLPSAAPDALHPDIPRVQLTATVYCRTTL